MKVCIHFFGEKTKKKAHRTYVIEIIQCFPCVGWKGKMDWIESITWCIFSVSGSSNGGTIFHFYISHLFTYALIYEHSMINNILKALEFNVPCLQAFRLCTENDEEAKLITNGQWKKTGSIIIIIKYKCDVYFPFLYLKIPVRLLPVAESCWFGTKGLYLTATLIL